MAQAMEKKMEAEVRIMESQMERKLESVIKTKAT